MQRRSRPFFCAALAVLGPGAVQAAEGDFEPVTPYRPSVTNSAQLPAVGQLEMEFGGVRMRSSDERRTELPYLLKLAFTPEWAVLLGGDAHVWQHDADGRASSVGDTSLAVRRAWRVDEATAFGADFTALLPTADDRIGSRKTDFTANGIVSRDLGVLHVDVNLNATRVGSPDTGYGRVKYGASAAVGPAESGTFGWVGEFSATRQSGEGYGAQVLAALTWSPSKFVIFDIGVARAWKPTPAAMQVFAGVVFPIAKLW